MSNRKKMDDRLEQGIKLVMEIKKNRKAGTAGQYKCICGKMLSFSIASNNHIHLFCPDCKLSIME